MTAEAAIRDDLSAAEDTLRQDIEDFAGVGVETVEDIDEPNVESDL